MDYYIRMVFGILQSKLQSSLEDKPNQGILQGNGSSLVAQIAASTPMINEMKEQGHKIIFTLALSNKKTKSIGYMLVDNMDLIDAKLYDTRTDIEKVAIQI